MYEDMKTRNPKLGYIYFDLKSKNVYSDSTEANLCYCNRPKIW